MIAWRAIGIALELAFKKGFSEGFPSVSADHLKQVRVSGDTVEVKQSNGSWQAPDWPVRVDLNDADKDYAFAIYQRMCDLLVFLAFNISDVDRRLAGFSHDLIGSFLDPARAIVKGLVSAELKVTNARIWQKQTKTFKNNAKYVFKQCQTSVRAFCWCVASLLWMRLATGQILCP